MRGLRTVGKIGINKDTVIRHYGPDGMRNIIGEVIGRR